jgi:hypothetical protein
MRVTRAAPSASTDSIWWLPVLVGPTSGNKFLRLGAHLGRALGVSSLFIAAAGAVIPLNLK